MFNPVKYRSFIFNFSFIFLIFSLLTPIFHYHPLESEPSQDKSQMIHSHLFNDSNQGSHSKESEEHSEDEDHSSHLLFVNYAYSTTSQRALGPFNNSYFHTTIKYSVADHKIYTINTPTLNAFSKIQLEKYVHSAGNVSPPLI